MIGIEIVHPVTKEPNGEGLLTILQKCMEKGVLFYFCGNAGEVVRMIPPLTVSKEEIDLGLSIFEEAIAEYEREFMNGGGNGQ
jgi:4-aminobutyrate aminotransferase